MAKNGGTVETVTGFIFWALKSLQMVTVAMKLLVSCCSWGRTELDSTEAP